MTTQDGRIVSKKPPATSTLIGVAVVFFALTLTVMMLAFGSWDVSNQVKVTVSGGREVVGEDNALIHPEEDLVITVDQGLSGRLAAALVAAGFLIAVGGVLIGVIDASRQIDSTPPKPPEDQRGLLLGTADVVKAVVEPLSKARPAAAAIIGGLLLAGIGAVLLWQNGAVAEAALNSPAASPLVVIPTTTTTSVVATTPPPPP